MNDITIWMALNSLEISKFIIDIRMILTTFVRV